MRQEFERFIDTENNSLLPPKSFRYKQDGNIGTNDYKARNIISTNQFIGKFQFINIDQLFFLGHFNISIAGQIIM